MDTNSSSKTKIGVLLVGHGSRLPYGKDVVSQIAKMYREDQEFVVVVGFMNMSKPSIPEAITMLADKGAEKIIVTPVFLAHGVHTTEDIPRILGLNNGHDEKGDKAHSHSHSHSHDHEEVEINFKGEIIYTEPLGADKRIADIVKDRVNDAL
ncbi:sirohydrochlorin nickelochelatase [Methanobacterium sp. SMA-27]|uniref:sirohydrochlorin nickelochelatase n=1 Tax=Methanobacterium sp. SMA-27 TaxID=1495336 RepID=UPI00064E499E|nr:sirohydrochlorin nickelochelatase [Methanobacterium sp. SMA-27]